ncbi:MAG: hypothetical protein MR945_09205 [Agathobacter sp.]|nr:hypothetical protein [Agathobacter sp.]
MAEKLEKENDVSMLICSAGVLADMLGIKETTVRHLASSGVMPRVSSGRYKLRDCVHNYVMQLRIQSKTVEQSTDNKPELRDMQAKHEVVKLKMSELRLKQMEGKLHKSEDVERVMTNMLASMRAKLLSMPSRVAQRVAQCSDANEVMTIIQAELYDALHELSEYTPEMFYGDDLILDEDGNVIEDDSTVSESDTEVKS